MGILAAHRSWDNLSRSTMIAWWRWHLSIFRKVLGKIHGRQTLSSLCNSVMFYVFHSPVTFFWATYMSFQATKKFPPLQYIISIYDFHNWHATCSKNSKFLGARVQGLRLRNIFSSAERKEFLRPWGLDIRSWLSCVKLLGGSIPTKPWEVYVRANGLVDGDSWWLDSWTYKVAKTFKKLRIRMLFDSLIQFKSSSWVASVGSPCACHIHIQPRIHKRLTTYLEYYCILLEYV